jgi:membrane glycosyltransferase
MSIRQRQFLCKQCARRTLHQKETFSGALGCFFTLITAGLFLPFWLLADMAGLFRPYRCQTCGSAHRIFLGGVVLALLILGLWAAVVYLIVKNLN